MMSYKAFVLYKEENSLHHKIENLEETYWQDGDIWIDVAYSSVNYKDAYVVKDGSLAETSPLIPGIDLAGTVRESNNPSFQKGQAVIATSYRIGTGHHGGYAQVARIPSEWVIPLPDGLTLKEAMILGTAGLTAALSIQKLENNGLTPDQGPVVVPGATGGVGSLAVNMLSNLGYEVIAGTGKDDKKQYLLQIGASEVVNRQDLQEEAPSSPQKAKWAGAVDPVGGNTLSYILNTLKRGGSVATSGFTAGTNVQTTVFPFIGRGVNWLGIDSVTCSMKERTDAWHRLATDLKPTIFQNESIQEVTLEELDHVFEAMLAGKTTGRTIVAL